MKLNLLSKLPLFALLLISISCNNSSINSEQSEGKILLKIDRANAPSSVTLITVTLSREGYSNITSTLNLLSDSTADLLMDNIPAGNWHLKVDAMNDSMVVLYTGETEVKILAGFVTNINLNLQPTGQGTGSIYIYVIWGGATQNNWIDNPSNPILSKSGNYFDDNGVRYPHILFENGTYKMWFTNLQTGGIGSIGYATSINGLNWTRPINHPVITRGSYNSWDDYSVAIGAVMYENNQYKLYYSGVSHNQNSGVGLAFSSDGINWVKHPQPLIVNENIEDLITVDEVIKVGNQYSMYYSSRNLPFYSIKMAFSNDGINWVKYSNNPILSPTFSWEGTGIYAPSIYFDGNNYHMVYMNASATAFGEAISTDGINWIKVGNQPFWRASNINWANSIQYPYWRIINNQLRLYYAGTSNSGDCIGFAYK
uniref:Glycosyl hydrolase family 32 N-terminal domain-containing protein n=1 Tax=Ignavibacterium album TaxID=591197 RepID=A0A832G834_9BACT